jgi:hypothetical protein
MGKKSRSGSGIGDEQPGSYFRELGNNFLGLKQLKFFGADADPAFGIFLILDLGSRMEKFGSRINIPDPQHWFLSSYRTMQL